ncbi:hypothetical protein TRAPUB_8511 [Trametes pubescens]|uniref:Uncharacterized protein n=1 Tax=Trametes pubescens TaxID=154538 RepID=A0A1M2W514_TRAPU|nr:hypothetical protein TRAPUB_8511 [Trametes pubescens]
MAAQQPAYLGMGIPSEPHAALRAPLNSDLRFRAHTGRVRGGAAESRATLCGGVGGKQHVGVGGARNPSSTIARHSSGLVGVVHGHGHSQCSQSLGLKGGERPGTPRGRCSVSFAGDVSVSDGRGCEEAYGLWGLRE